MELTILNNFMIFVFSIIFSVNLLIFINFMFLNKEVQERYGIWVLKIISCIGFTIPLFILRELILRPDKVLNLMETLPNIAIIEIIIVMSIFYVHSTSKETDSKEDKTTGEESKNEEN